MFTIVSTQIIVYLLLIFNNNLYGGLENKDARDNQFILIV